MNSDRHPEHKMAVFHFTLFLYTDRYIIARAYCFFRNVQSWGLGDTAIAVLGFHKVIPEVVDWQVGIKSCAICGRIIVLVPIPMEIRGIIRIEVVNVQIGRKFLGTFFVASGKQCIVVGCGRDEEGGFG